MLLGDKFISIDALKLGVKRIPWKIGLANGKVLDETFLGQLLVNPVYYKVTKQQSVAQEWENVYLMAYYSGEAVAGYGTTSVWFSVNNDVSFAIRLTDIRRKPLNWLEHLHIKACKSKTPEHRREGITARECIRVECKVPEIATMKAFLNLRTKTGGSNCNTCEKVEVQSKSIVRLEEGTQLILDPKELKLMKQYADGDTLAPLLHQARVLNSNEFIPTDFQRQQTIFEIVKEIGGCKTSLNDMPANVIMKAIQTFSGHRHSVTLDPPASPQDTKLIEIIVDIDSTSAVYKRRHNDEKQDIEAILDSLTTHLGPHLSGFNACTNYIPTGESFQAFSSKLKGGPTIEMYEKSVRYRVQLPTPIGNEVFKIWIYSPAKMKHSDLIKSVKMIAHRCAIKLMDQYAYRRQTVGLQTTCETDTQGGRPYQIPGGYKFPLGIALMFLEENPEGSFAVETYGSKSKGARFVMTPQDFGTKKWLYELVFQMKKWIKFNETVLKTICSLDRVAKLDADLSRVGFGFECRFIFPNPTAHKSMLIKQLFRYQCIHTGKPMYSSCQPSSLRKTTYPMAFLPKEISSHLSYMDDKFETRLQSYVPELNQINWRRSKSRSTDSNLGIKHNIHKGTGALLIK